MSDGIEAIKKYKMNPQDLEGDYEEVERKLGEQVPDMTLSESLTGKDKAKETPKTDTLAKSRIKKTVDKLGQTAENIEFKASTIFSDAGNIVSQAVDVANAPFEYAEDLGGMAIDESRTNIKFIDDIGVDGVGSFLKGGAKIATGTVGTISGLFKSEEGSTKASRKKIGDGFSEAVDGIKNATMGWLVNPDSKTGKTIASDRIEQAVEQFSEDIDRVSENWEAGKFSGTTKAAGDILATTVNLANQPLKFTKDLGSKIIENTRTDIEVVDGILVDGGGKVLKGGAGIITGTVGVVGGIFSSKEGSIKNAAAEVGEGFVDAGKGIGNVGLTILGKGWIWGDDEEEKESEKEPPKVAEEPVKKPAPRKVIRRTITLNPVDPPSERPKGRRMKIVLTPVDSASTSASKPAVTSSKGRKKIVLTPVDTASTSAPEPIAAPPVSPENIPAAVPPEVEQVKPIVKDPPPAVEKMEQPEEKNSTPRKVKARIVELHTPTVPSPQPLEVKEEDSVPVAPAPQIPETKLSAFIPEPENKMPAPQKTQPEPQKKSSVDEQRKLPEPHLPTPPSVEEPEFKNEPLPDVEPPSANGISPVNPELTPEIPQPPMPQAIPQMGVTNEMVIRQLASSPIDIELSCNTDVVIQLVNNGSLVSNKVVNLRLGSTRSESEVLNEFVQKIGESLNSGQICAISYTDRLGVRNRAMVLKRPDGAVDSVIQQKEPEKNDNFGEFRSLPGETVPIPQDDGALTISIGDGQQDTVSAIFERFDEHVRQSNVPLERYDLSSAEAYQQGETLLSEDGTVSTSSQPLVASADGPLLGNASSQDWGGDAYYTTLFDRISMPFTFDLNLWNSFNSQAEKTAQVDNEPLPYGPRVQGQSETASAETQKKDDVPLVASAEKIPETQKEIDEPAPAAADSMPLATLPMSDVMDSAYTPLLLWGTTNLARLTPQFTSALDSVDDKTPLCFAPKKETPVVDVPEVQFELPYSKLSENPVPEEQKELASEIVRILAKSPFSKEADSRLNELTFQYAQGDKIVCNTVLPILSDNNLNPEATSGFIRKAILEQLGPNETCFVSYKKPDGTVQKFLIKKEMAADSGVVFSDENSYQEHRMLKFWEKQVADSGLPLTKDTALYSDVTALQQIPGLQIDNNIPPVLVLDNSAAETPVIPSVYPKMPMLDIPSYSSYSSSNNAPVMAASLNLQDLYMPSIKKNSNNNPTAVYWKALAPEEQKFTHRVAGSLVQNVRTDFGKTEQEFQDVLDKEGVVSDALNPLIKIFGGTSREDVKEALGLKDEQITELETFIKNGQMPEFLDAYKEMVGAEFRMLNVHKFGVASKKYEKAVQVKKLADATESLLQEEKTNVDRQAVMYPMGFSLASSSANYNLDSFENSSKAKVSNYSPLEKTLFSVYQNKEVALAWIKERSAALGLDEKSPKERYQALVEDFTKSIEALSDATFKEQSFETMAEEFQQTYTALFGKDIPKEKLDAYVSNQALAHNTLNIGMMIGLGMFAGPVACAAIMGAVSTLEKSTDKDGLTGKEMAFVAGETAITLVGLKSMTFAAKGTAGVLSSHLTKAGVKQTTASAVSGLAGEVAGGALSGGVFGTGATILAGETDIANISKMAFVSTAEGAAFGALFGGVVKAFGALKKARMSKGNQPVPKDIQDDIVKALEQQGSKEAKSLASKIRETGITDDAIADVNTFVKDTYVPKMQPGSVKDDYLDFYKNMDETLRGKSLKAQAKIKAKQEAIRKAELREAQIEQARVRYEAEVATANSFAISSSKAAISAKVKSMLSNIENALGLAPKAGSMKLLENGKIYFVDDATGASCILSTSADKNVLVMKGVFNGKKFVNNHIFDKKGIQVSSKEVDLSDFSTMESTYYENGRIKTFKRTNTDGKVVANVEYNMDGSWLRKLPTDEVQETFRKKYYIMDRRISVKTFGDIDMTKGSFAEFDMLGRVRKISVKKPEGVELYDFTYSKNGNLSKSVIVKPDGIKTLIEYDKNGMITKVRQIKPKAEVSKAEPAKNAEPKPEAKPAQKAEAPTAEPAKEASSKTQISDIQRKIDEIVFYDDADALFPKTFGQKIDEVYAAIRHLEVPYTTAADDITKMLKVSTDGVAHINASGWNTRFLQGMGEIKSLQHVSLNVNPDAKLIEALDNILLKYPKKLRYKYLNPSSGDAAEHAIKWGSRIDPITIYLADGSDDILREIQKAVKPFVRDSFGAISVGKEVSKGVCVVQEPTEQAWKSLTARARKLDYDFADEIQDLIKRNGSLSAGQFRAIEDICQSLERANAAKTAPKTSTAKPTPQQPSSDVDGAIPPKSNPLDPKKVKVANDGAISKKPAQKIVTYDKADKLQLQGYGDIDMYRGSKAIYDDMGRLVRIETFLDGKPTVINLKYLENSKNVSEATFLFKNGEKQILGYDSSRQAIAEKLFYNAEGELQLKLQYDVFGSVGRKISYVNEETLYEIGKDFKIKLNKNANMIYDSNGKLIEILNPVGEKFETVKVEYYGLSKEIKRIYHVSVDGKTFVI